MKTIRIDRGVNTRIYIDLSKFDFTDVDEVVMTFNNFPAEATSALFERRFTQPKVYREIITPQESMKLRGGALYDFDKICYDGRRYKLTDRGRIEIRKGCGQC